MSNELMTITKLYEKRIFFSNGYGVSIICKAAEVGGIEVASTYGAVNNLFEVAILKGNEDEWNIFTQPTSDVLGHLDFQDVADVIKKVKELPKG